AYSNILPTFAFTYGTVFLAILLLRLDYSRFQALGSFVMSISWYFSVSMFVRRREPYRLAIVPGGSVDRLRPVPGVIWQILASPTEPVGKVQGVVADLRADLS